MDKRTNTKGCEMLRIPHCVDSRLKDGGKIVPAALYSPETLFF
jgi:hypothetical protein